MSTTLGGMMQVPTHEELVLEREVNRQSPPDTHVNVYRREMPDDETKYGVIMCHHDHRQRVEREVPWTAHELVEMLKDWAEHAHERAVRRQQRWSADPNDAARF